MSDPSQRLEAPVKYLFTNSVLRPIVSKICAPRYDATVEMPILAMVLTTPLIEPLRKL